MSNTAAAANPQLNLVNSILVTTPIEVMFPDVLRVCVIPSTTPYRARVVPVPLKKRESSMEAYLEGVIKDRSRTHRIVAQGPGVPDQDFTAFASTEANTNNSLLSHLAPQSGWKGDVVVIKHQGTEEKLFADVEEQDVPLIIECLIRMQV
ncbi:hypothetical protein SCHPADRAFT_946873 [Schizopora paradoxa]|uniref:Uncharacterized protein n=1 Tax=Schizopora paradoxa TaxID=27342 RepID=A0A0H2R7P8_9AGAM|nr:hypothetical protein SCHPADRAFT_946873 [Schizopora paradoxa]